MSTAYSPKYIESLGDVPLTGPDPYDDAEKHRAVRDGESKLEADVNDGTEIPAESVEHIHALAANAYASYILALGPKEPSSVMAGDLADEGSNRTAFADHLLAIYEDAVKSINAAGGDESGGGGGEGGADSSVGNLRSSII